MGTLDRKKPKRCSVDTKDVENWMFGALRIALKDISYLQAMAGDMAKRLQMLEQNRNSTECSTIAQTKSFVPGFEVDLDSMAFVLEEADLHPDGNTIDASLMASCVRADSFNDMEDRIDIVTDDQAIDPETFTVQVGDDSLNFIDRNGISSVGELAECDNNFATHVGHDHLSSTSVENDGDEKKIDCKLGEKKAAFAGKAIKKKRAKNNQVKAAVAEAEKKEEENFQFERTLQQFLEENEQSEEEVFAPLKNQELKEKMIQFILSMRSSDAGKIKQIVAEVMELSLLHPSEEKVANITGSVLQAVWPIKDQLSAEVLWRTLKCHILNVYENRKV